MIKLATITPINCITNEQDGEIFEVVWDCDNCALSAVFEGGRSEDLDYTAATLVEAMDTVYSLYAQSIAYIYEPEEVEV